MLPIKNILLKTMLLASLTLTPGFAASQNSQDPVVQPVPQTTEVPYEQLLREEKQNPPPKEIDPDEIACLARNIYYEARGEGEAGMRAVAHVTLNRVRSPLFKNTICGVVHQPYQFSWVRMEKSNPRGSTWEMSQRIAEEVYLGQDPGDNTGGATYFHSKSVRPSWTRRLTYTVTIGRHVFYSQ
jgi:spore germination cell wall hydrolase CwlJ-like protein